MKLSSLKYPIAAIDRLRIGADGDGVRTLVLLCGCTLRCRMCINPYTWDGSREPRMYSADELYSKISIDRPYMLATCGGITFGGGEPMLYPELFNEIRDIFEPELTIYAETALNVPWDNIAQSLSSVDRYFVDIKTMDAAKYEEYTGKTPELAVDNLSRLLETKGPEALVVRIPEIPGLTDRESQLSSMDALKALGVTQFDLFRYKEV